MKFRAGVLLAVTAALAASCATTTVAPPAPDTAPAPSSPANTVRRFEWAFNHKDAAMVRDLLTDDFLFISAGTDSAGNPSRVPHTGGWFVAALAAMMDSSTTVSLVLDENLIPFPDSRPGREPRFHKQLRSSIDLRIFGTANFEITGNALFFLTRGDSAAIPKELISRGVKPDSTTWWIDRFEDETLGVPGAPADTNPSRNISFGWLLEYFLTRRLAH